MTESDRTAAIEQVTPAVLLQAVGLVRRGKVYRLAHPLDPAMPHLVDGPVVGRGRRLAVEQRTIDLPQFGARVFSESVAFDTHTGTHIDTPAHWSWNGRMHGGLDVAQGESPGGKHGLGLDGAAPLVTRGVLIDMAGDKGR